MGVKAFFFATSKRQALVPKPAPTSSVHNEINGLTLHLPKLDAMLSLVVRNLAQLVLLDNNLSCFQGLKYFNVSFWLMIKVIFIIMPLGTNLRLGELSESQV